MCSPDHVALNGDIAVRQATSVELDAKLRWELVQMQHHIQHLQAQWYLHLDSAERFQALQPFALYVATEMSL